MAKDPRPMGWFSSEEKIAYSFPVFAVSDYFSIISKSGVFSNHEVLRRGQTGNRFTLFYSLSVQNLASVFVARLVLLLRKDGL